MHHYSTNKLQPKTTKSKATQVERIGHIQIICKKRSDREQYLRDITAERTRQTQNTPTLCSKITLANRDPVHTALDKLCYRQCIHSDLLKMPGNVKF